MKYVMLIFQGDALERHAALSEEELKQVYADYQGINQTPGVTPVPPMGLPENATTVRVEGVRTLTTDGPFVGMKEAVGGVFVREADDLDAAIEMPPASRRPATVAPSRSAPRRCLGNDARPGLPRGVGPRPGHADRLPRRLRQRRMTSGTQTLKRNTITR